MQASWNVRLKILLKDAYSHRKWLLMAFVCISLAAVIIGLRWPKIYTSSATIYVEEHNIISPLMEGTAVATNVKDRAQNARELIYGRGFLSQVLKAAGWYKQLPDPTTLEHALNSLRQRITITTTGDNLIKVSFKDNDPQRAYLTTRKIAELFIHEMRSAKQQESRAAFEFIDSQVKNYESGLQNTENQLKELRNKNVDARPEAANEVDQRITLLRNRIDELEQQLRESQIKASSLENQLTGEAEASVVMSRADEYRKRSSELRTQLETLRLSYQDSYPDIVQLKAQITDLEKAAAEEERKRIAAKSQAALEGKAYIDDSVRGNPIYLELQRKLYDTRTEIKTLQARLGEAKRNLAEELDRTKRIQDVSATVGKLNSDMQLNQGIYQDLLRRREHARVSMNLDLDQQGLTLSINEPAYLPNQPSGPRLVHFTLGGLLAGILLPLAVLFGIERVYPRIRMADRSLEEALGAPILVTLPHYVTRSEANTNQRFIYLSFLVVLADFMVIGLIMVLRLRGYL